MKYSTRGRFEQILILVLFLATVHNRIQFIPCHPNVLILSVYLYLQEITVIKNHKVLSPSS